MIRQTTMNASSHETESKEIMRTLYLLMQLSVKAYKKYMQNKIYLHALVLRSSNKKIYDYLLTHLLWIPESLEDDVLQLLNHYDIWMEQFREFEAIHKPILSDSFIFYHLDEQSAFPKEAERRVYNYYHHLNNSIKKSTDE